MEQVFKQYVRQQYEEYVLLGLRRPSGTLRPPSRQQLATWCCNAWDRITGPLVVKAFLSTRISRPEQYENVVIERAVVENETPEIVQELSQDALGQCYATEELTPLLQGEVPDVDDLVLAMETESVDGEDEDEVFPRWSDFQAHLSAHGLRVEARALTGDALLGQRVGFMWERPRGWSLGQVVARASRSHQAKGLNFDVNYNETLFPQQLSLDMHRFGPDAPPGSWVIVVTE